MDTLPFHEEIEWNKSIDSLDDPRVTVLNNGPASLAIRERGCYITSGQLFSPELNQTVDVLYSDNDLSVPKISASHPMVPAGPYDGVGGQHGFPRWADYNDFPLPVGPDGDKRASFKAERSDLGLSLNQEFRLNDSTITIHTDVGNPDPEEAEHTSIGEHFYFKLEDERIEGLRINGQSLDELLGEGSEDAAMSQETLLWDFDGGEAIIDFPAGHSVRLTAEFEGDTDYPLQLWIWKRKDSESICFEPVVGVDENLNNDGVRIEPGDTATLSTRIELL